MQLSRLGLVVHPTRELDRAIGALRTWAVEHGADVVQIDAGKFREGVAPRGDATSCDVIVAVGGDGTVLAAVRAGAEAGRPVLGVSCGSLGALATVSAAHVGAALDAVEAGRWAARPLPALIVVPDGGSERTAVNDVVVVRESSGQIAVSLLVDGELYGSFTGDGVVLSTPVGSSAYTLAAGGPILAAGANAMVVTPLSAHGGCLPPLVAAAGSTVRVEVDAGHTGARTELDGRPAELGASAFDVTLRPGHADLVSLGDEEPQLRGLRRRGILLDSPRIVARAAREARAADAARAATAAQDGAAPADLARSSG
jgi:NAD+ kinase